MTHRIFNDKTSTTDPTEVAQTIVLKATEGGCGHGPYVPKIVIWDDSIGENGIGDDGIWLNPEQAEAIAHRLIILAEAARDLNEWTAHLPPADQSDISGTHEDAR